MARHGTVAEQSELAQYKACAVSFNAFAAAHVGLIGVKSSAIQRGAAEVDGQGESGVSRSRANQVRMHMEPGIDVEDQSGIDSDSKA